MSNALVTTLKYVATLTYQTAKSVSKGTLSHCIPRTKFASEVSKAMWKRFDKTTYA